MKNMKVALPIVIIEVSEKTINVTLIFFYNLNYNNVTNIIIH